MLMTNKIFNYLNQFSWGNYPFSGASLIKVRIGRWLLNLFFKERVVERAKLDRLEWQNNFLKDKVESFRRKNAALHKALLFAKEGVVASEGARGDSPPIAPNPFLNLSDREFVQMYEAPVND